MQGQSSDVSASNYMLLTGVAKAKIVAINPNNEKLKKVDINVKEDAKEPEYTGLEINEEVYSKLKFLLRIEGDLEMPDKTIKHYNQIVNLEFLISNRDDASSTGNVKFINNFGNSAYSSTKDNPKMGWFWKVGNPVPAKQGEVVVTEFLRAFLNTDIKSEGKIKNWAKIVNGDTNEIKGYIQNFINNFVYVLLGYKEVEKEGKISYYPVVFNRFFVRGGNDTPITAFRKFMDTYTGTFLYQNDLRLKKLDTDNLPKPDKESNESNDFDLGVNNQEAVDSFGEGNKAGLLGKSTDFPAGENETDLF